MIKCGSRGEAQDEQDVETLRQISLLLDRGNQRLITKNLQLTAELARLRGVSDVEQLAFSVQHALQQPRAQIFQRKDVAPLPAPRPMSRLPAKEEPRQFQLRR
jgi:hypothetical protein